MSTQLPPRRAISAIDAVKAGDLTRVFADICHEVDLDGAGTLLVAEMLATRALRAMRDPTVAAALAEALARNILQNIERTE